MPFLFLLHSYSRSLSQTAQRTIPSFPHATIPAITAKKTFTPIKEASPLAEVSPIKCCQKELKSLEANRLIERNVYDTFARTVEYSITAHGLSLDKVLNELHYWGLAHRKKIIGK